MIFKTFTPFSLYDKIRSDDKEILTALKQETRKIILQEAYDKINSDYHDTKIRVGSITNGIKERLKNINWLVALILGVFVIPLIWILALDLEIAKFGITKFGIYVVLPIITSIAGNIIWKITDKNS